MAINLKQNFLQYITVLIAAVVLLFGVFFGLKNGRLSAEAKLTYENAGAYEEALEYFKLDQDRYPSAPEFKDSNIMTVYLSNFPPLVFDNCEQSFAYLRSQKDHYKLSFCLQSDQQGFDKGWNSITK